MVDFVSGELNRPVGECRDFEKAAGGLRSERVCTGQQNCFGVMYLETTAMKGS